MITIFEKNIAQEISRTFERQKIISLNPIKINFRCPYCGDSATNSSKTRGWFYEYENHLRYGCFNCNYNLPIGTYLKENYPEYYRSWVRDKRGVTDTEQQKEADLEKKLFSIDRKKIKELEYCERIDLLSENHPARKYLVNRKIPQENLHLFYFTKEWKKLANWFGETETYNKVDPEPRIVIPFWDNDGIEVIQGRAVRDIDEIRYITVKRNEESLKIFGRERVKQGDVFIFEGPIDSTFINNAIAIAGGQLDPSVVPYKNRRVWVLDNENRSTDTMNRYQKLIDEGERIVIWDKCLWKSKDVNDMIIEEGATPESMLDYLKNNIVSGLRAENRFSRWRHSSKKSKQKPVEKSLRDRLNERF